MTSSVETLGIRIKPEEWMRNARCVYGNTDEFLGAQVRDSESGRFLMSMTEFFERFDAAFFSQHDERWTSGGESLSLASAVQECLKCPVRVECLRHAVADDTTTNIGIAGATTPWERRTVMSTRRFLLAGLDRESRIRVLERLIAAKEQGFVRLSTQTDHLSRWLESGLSDEVDEAIASRIQVALDAEEAEDIAAEGEVPEETVEVIADVMTKGWAEMTSDDLERLIEYLEGVAR